MSKSNKITNVKAEKSFTEIPFTEACESVKHPPKGGFTFTPSRMPQIRQIMPCREGALAIFVDEHRKVSHKAVVALAIVEYPNLDDDGEEIEGTWSDIRGVCFSEQGFFVVEDADSFCKYAGGL